MHIDLTNIKIETERLILRAFNKDDLADLYAYASVPGVGEAAGWPHHKSIEESEQILKSFIEKGNVFAIFHKEEKKAIGSLGLHNSWADEKEEYSGKKIKSIGYVLSKDFWGHGLMTEAVSAVIDFGFSVLCLDAFTCGHFVENSRSRRVIENAGLNS